MTRIHPIEPIVSDPEIKNGQPLIAGTRLQVLDLVSAHLYRGLSAEELAVNYALELGQVYAALAYYYQNKTRIDADLRADAQQTHTLLDQLAQQGKLLRSPL